MLTPLLLIGLAATAGALLLMRQAHGAAVWWTALAGNRTESELATLFVFIPAGHLLAATLAFTALVTLLATLMHLPGPLVVMLAAATLALPRLMLVLMRNRWRRQLVHQLPDTLSLWAGLLRAGQSSQQALAQVAQRQRGPLGDELRFILGQLRLGIALDRAFSALCERAALPDLRLLSTLLATQRELGGNLAESLQRLAELLRSRLLMEARINSLTAQGRLQGIVVGVLPLLLLGALYVMEREAMQVLHTTWQGWVALGLIAVLELVGYLLIRRIVKIEV